MNKIQPQPTESWSRNKTPFVTDIKSGKTLTYDEYQNELRIRSGKLQYEKQGAIATGKNIFGGGGAGGGGAGRGNDIKPNPTQTPVASKPEQPRITTSETSPTQSPVQAPSQRPSAMVQLDDGRWVERSSNPTASGWYAGGVTPTGKDLTPYKYYKTIDGVKTEITKTEYEKIQAQPTESWSRNKTPFVTDIKSGKTLTYDEYQNELRIRSEKLQYERQGAIATGKNIIEGEKNPIIKGVVSGLLVEHTLLSPDDNIGYAYITGDKELAKQRLYLKMGQMAQYTDRYGSWKLFEKQIVVGLTESATGVAGALIGKYGILGGVIKEGGVFLAPRVLAISGGTKASITASEFIGAHAMEISSAAGALLSVPLSSIQKSGMTPEQKDIATARYFYELGVSGYGLSKGFQYGLPKPYQLTTPYVKPLVQESVASGSEAFATTRGGPKEMVSIMRRESAFPFENVKEPAGTTGMYGSHATGQAGAFKPNVKMTVSGEISRASDSPVLYISSARRWSVSMLRTSGDIAPNNYQPPKINVFASPQLLLQEVKGFRRLPASVRGGKYKSDVFFRTKAEKGYSYTTWASEQGKAEIEGGIPAGTVIKPEKTIAWSKWNGIPFPIKVSRLAGESAGTTTWGESYGTSIQAFKESYPYVRSTSRSLFILTSAFGSSKTSSRASSSMMSSEAYSSSAYSTSSSPRSSSIYSTASSVMSSLMSSTSASSSLRSASSSVGFSGSSSSGTTPPPPPPYIFKKKRMMPVFKMTSKFKLPKKSAKTGGLNLKKLLIPDILSETVSQARYGISTEPKPTRKFWGKYEKGSFVGVPTKELMEKKAVEPLGRMFKKLRVI